MRSTILALAASIGLLLSTVDAQSPTCTDGYTCFEEESTNILWVMGNSISSSCSDTCEKALSGPSEYLCKENHPTFTDDAAFNHIADGLGFNCKTGRCWGGSSGDGGMMWISNTNDDNRNCYYPTSDFYSCSNTVGNGNCFGERYNLVCPCQKKEDIPPTPSPTCNIEGDSFSCNDPYTCWKDENADIVWAMGGGIFETCKSTCLNALDQYSDFYACKSNQASHTDKESFKPISTGMGFNCKEGRCGFDSGSGEMWIDQTQNCERTCHFPTTESEYYSCDDSVDNSNCFGERYTLACPCNVKPLDQACEWSCPDHSASVALWPEDEDGTSCLERINYWRKRACEENWPECPPAGLPPYVECTSCHQCANTQSEYDAIHGAHQSFKRCGEFVQGSGGGRTCADVIDSFVSERESSGLCQGHCGPIVKHGCSTFHWGRTEEQNSWGGYFYTLNWGNCNTDKCDAHCDSVAGTNDACFSSGIEPAGCGTSGSPVKEPTSMVPSSAPSDLPSIVLSSSPSEASMVPSSAPSLLPASCTGLSKKICKNSPNCIYGKKNLIEKTCKFKVEFLGCPAMDKKACKASPKCKYDKESKICQDACHRDLSKKACNKVKDENKKKVCNINKEKIPNPCKKCQSVVECPS